MESDSIIIGKTEKIELSKVEKLIRIMRVLNQEKKVMRILKNMMKKKAMMMISRGLVLAAIMMTAVMETLRKMKIRIDK